MYLGTHVECLTFCPSSTKSGVSRKIFTEVPNIKFTEICLVGAALIHADRQTARQTDVQTDGLMYMTKLTGAFPDCV